MTEMAHASEHHGQPGVIGSGNHLIIAYRPTGLNNRRGTRFSSA
jgi:hypothetical protein